MKRFPSSAVVMVGLAGLLGASLLQPRLLNARHGPVVSSASRADANESPLVVFTTVALGGLRGLLTDMLWVKVTSLQEQGDYVEIAQLADWITKLEPRLAIVWDFHSFNMAYNVSIMCSDPADRWRWVSSGIRMLRREAIPNNPSQAVLYDRLCRIFRHKLVEKTDPAQPYYRLAWAKEMARLFSDGRPDYGKIRSDPQLADQLLMNYGLDPQLMMEIDLSYGPLDWRLPEPQIIYWAKRGMRHASNAADPVFDMMICEAVAESCLNGRVTEFKPSGNVLATEVYPGLIPKALAAFGTTSSKHDMALESDSGLGLVYRQFLRRGVVLLHDKSLDEGAQELYALLRNDLHEKRSDLPIDEYVRFIRTAPVDVDPIEQRKKDAIAKHHH